MSNDDQQNPDEGRVSARIRVRRVLLEIDFARASFLGNNPGEDLPGNLRLAVEAAALLKSHIRVLARLRSYAQTQGLEEAVAVMTDTEEFLDQTFEDLSDDALDKLLSAAEDAAWEAENLADGLCLIRDHAILESQVREDAAEIQVENEEAEEEEL